MSTKTLYRLSGVALLLGSLCAFLFAAIRAIVLEANSPGPVTGPQSPLWQPVNLMIMLGLMFILAGLAGFGVALLSRQRVEAVPTQPVATEVTS